MASAMCQHVLHLEKDRWDHGSAPDKAGLMHFASTLPWLSASLLQMDALGLLGVTVNGQLWWMPLLSVTSQFSIQLRFKCMSRLTCLKSSSHQKLLNSGLTAGWIAFNLRLISYLSSLTYHYCYNTYYQCWWMLLWLFYFWSFQLFFISCNNSESKLQAMKAPTGIEDFMRVKSWGTHLVGKETGEPG